MFSVSQTNTRQCLEEDPGETVLAATTQEVQPAVLSIQDL